MSARTLAASRVRSECTRLPETNSRPASPRTAEPWASTSKPPPSGAIWPKLDRIEPLHHATGHTAPQVDSNGGCARSIANARLHWQPALGEAHEATMRRHLLDATSARQGAGRRVHANRVRHGALALDLRSIIATVRAGRTTSSHTSRQPYPSNSSIHGRRPKRMTRTGRPGHDPPRCPRQVEARASGRQQCDE